MLQRILGEPPHHCRRLLARRVPTQATTTTAPRWSSSSSLRQQINVPVGGGGAHDDNSHPNKNFSVPLTVADLHLRNEQLPFAYFFDETLNADALQASLTTVLQQEFAVAAGRLSPCFRSIVCTPADSIPLSIHDVECSREEWQAQTEHQGHVHQAGRGDFPRLLPLFDSLFAHDNDNNNNNDKNHNLLSVRVTYFGCGATCLGVTFNHCLADTASCVHFVQVWGQEMRRKRSVNRVCWERSKAAVSGMMTTDTAELMGITGNVDATTNRDNLLSSFHLPDWMTSWYSNNEDKEKIHPALPQLIDHEYVSLQFSLPVLRAMKAHGMAASSAQKGDNDKNSFVSTNDMVTAVGWLLKRRLSQDDDWNISVVVNLRGRIHGVGTFADSTMTTTGLFGNAITHVVAHMDPTPQRTTLRKRDARAAAHSIRQALQEALLKVPDQLARSRLGKRNDVVPSTNTFSTTSWGQLSPWNISFGDTAVVASFHGQPAHPLPEGRTFSSVIHMSEDGACVFDLFMPSDRADKARHLHEKLCDSYLQWHQEEIKNQSSRLQ